MEPGEVYIADFQEAGPHPVIVVSRRQKRWRRMRPPSKTALRRLWRFPPYWCLLPRADRPARSLTANRRWGAYPAG